MVATTLPEDIRRTLNDLVDGLSSQAGDYERLLRLSREQGEAAAATPPDVDGITARQQAKQALLLRIAERDEQLGPLKERWAAVREQVPEPAKAPLAEIVDRLGSAMRSLIDQEQETETVLAGCKETVRQRLAQIRQRQRASRLYGAEQGDTRFQDR